MATGLSNAVLTRVLATEVPNAAIVTALHKTDGVPMQHILASLLDLAYRPGLGHGIPARLKLHTAGDYTADGHIFPYLARTWNHGAAASDTDALVEPLRVLLRGSPRVVAVQTINDAVLATAEQPAAREAIHGALNMHMANHVFKSDEGSGFPPRPDREEYVAATPPDNYMVDVLRRVVGPSSGTSALVRKRATEAVQAQIDSTLGTLRDKLSEQDMALVSSLVDNMQYLAYVNNAATHVQLAKAADLSSFLRRARDAHLLGLHVVSDTGAPLSHEDEAESEEEGEDWGEDEGEGEGKSKELSLGGQSRARLLSATILAQSPLLSTLLDMNMDDTELSQSQKQKVVAVYDHLCDNYPYLNHGAFTTKLRTLIEKHVGPDAIGSLKRAGFKI